MRKIKNIHTINEAETIFENYINKAIYVIALISPIMTIPQFIEVWFNKNTSGVSIWTWGAYALVSFFWILYGFIHKEKPIIISQILLFILELAISVGVII